MASGICSTSNTGCSSSTSRRRWTGATSPASQPTREDGEYRFLGQSTTDQSHQSIATDPTADFAFVNIYVAATPTGYNWGWLAKVHVPTREETVVFTQDQLTESLNDKGPIAQESRLRMVLDANGDDVVCIIAIGGRHVVCRLNIGSGCINELFGMMTPFA